MHNSLEDHKTVLNILKTIPYATIATCDELGEPWNAPVHVAIDDNINLYWASTTDSTHSINIKNNNRVFIVMFNSSTTLYEGKGLYMRSIAREITDEKEIKFSKECMRKTLKPDTLISSLKPFKSFRKMYIAEPMELWINDAIFTDDGRLIKDLRRKINLEDLIKYKELVKSTT